ncbi:MAG: TRAP transporter small permease [Rhodocyclaceae bacterium]|nr:TRAP transporter small permease [Rhodocyclaceae bacterium]
MGKIIDRLEELIVATLMAIATIVIFISVVHRYASGFAIPGLQDWLLSLDLGWAQEFCIILFVWMAKFGAAYGVRTGIHVGVDIVINKLKDKPRTAMIHLGLACGVLFSLIIGIFGATFIWENGMAYATLSAFGMETGDHFEGPTTPDLEWPTWMVYAAVPLGSFLMLYRFIQVMIKFASTGELPSHDHGHVEGLEEGEVLTLGETIEIAEQREHAHAGMSEKDWEKTHHADDHNKQEK